MKEELRIEKGYLYPNNPQQQVVIIPDSHGNERSLYWSEELMKKLPDQISWIACEYILEGFDDHILPFVNNMPEEITDEMCNLFCNIFIYGKRTDPNQPCSKVYAPNVQYVRRLLHILKKCKNVICLEMNPRPQHVEESWARRLPEDGDGIVVVGAEHVLRLSKEIWEQRIINIYSIYRHFHPSPAYYFIKPMGYCPSNGETKLWWDEQRLRPGGWY